jgi:1-acyl-sn-glycerol-3-phosphate acyltransferase
VALRAPVDAVFYRLCQLAATGAAMVYVRPRYFDIPDLSRRKGGLLIVSNHQSFLDPVLIGIAIEDPIAYLARRDLFSIPGLGALLRGLGVRPVARGAVDSSALKTAIRLLRGGEALLMFPEGTRTHDGDLGTFKPGAAALAVRCAVPVLPVCVEGAYECWPRTRLLPAPGRVAVGYGRPRPSQGLGAAQLTALLRQDVEDLRRRLRAHLDRG